MNNFKLTLAYDGTDFLGWQKTKEGPSIEESLEKALAELLFEKISLQAASRTDAGVHAKGQVVNFFSATQNIDPLKLNALLPKTISVLEIVKTDKSFHPTLNAKFKEYLYYLDNTPSGSPHRRLYSWHFPRSLNLDKMKIAARDLLGCHNFAAFSNRRSKNNICSLFNVDIHKANNFFIFRIEGNRFLYKMVRNIVGSLVYAGCGKLASLASVLAGKKRINAGPAAPARGLFLKKIHY